MRSRRLTAIRQQPVALVRPCQARRRRNRRPVMGRRRPAAFRQQPAALVQWCRAHRRRYRRLVLRRRRLMAIRRRWLVGKEQQPEALVRPLRARRRAPDAHRSRRRPAVWHRPAAASCRGSAQSRRSRGVLHPAAPSCCSVPRGRRLDDLRDPRAAPSSRVM